MEHKLGEVFEDGGVKLVIGKSVKGCHSCHYWRDRYCTRNSSIEHCCKENREDNTDIVFLELKDNTNNNKDMEERNIKISLNTAKEWFNGSDETLKKLALQEYKEGELKDNLPKTWE